MLFEKYPRLCNRTNAISTHKPCTESIINAIVEKGQMIPFELLCHICFSHNSHTIRITLSLLVSTAYNMCTRTKFGTRVLFTN